MSLGENSLVAAYQEKGKRKVDHQRTRVVTAVNVPVFIIRIIFWRLQNKKISVVLVKNLMYNSKCLEDNIRVLFRPKFDNGRKSPESEMKETTPLVIEPLHYLGEVNVNFSQM